MTIPTPSRSKWIRWLPVAVLLSAVAFGLAGFHRVPPEHLGVQYHRFGDGTNLDAVLPSGVHWSLPWDSVFHYPVTAQDLLSETRTVDPQGAPVKIGYLIRFELEPTRVAALHQEVGPDYLEKLVHPTINSALASVAATHPMEPHQIGAADEWSRLASMQIGPAMESVGLHLIYFRVQSIVVPKD